MDDMWFHTGSVSCLGNITIWKNEWKGENGRRQIRKLLMKAMQESDEEDFQWLRWEMILMIEISRT